MSQIALHKLNLIAMIMITDMKLTAKSIFIGLAIAGPFAIGLVGCSSSGDTSGTAGTASTSGTASDSGAASSSTTTSSTAGETAGTAGSTASGTASGGSPDATNGSTGAQPAGTDSSKPVPAKGSDTGAKGETAMAGAVKFADIQKAFATNCMGCHSGPHPAHQLDLSSYESVMKGDKEGAVIVAGNPDKSRLFEAISHDPGAAAMPKGKPKLDAATIKAVHDWIMAGAKKD